MGSVTKGDAPEALIYPANRLKPVPMRCTVAHFVIKFANMEVTCEVLTVWPAAWADIGCIAEATSFWCRSECES